MLIWAVNWIARNSPLTSAVQISNTYPCIRLSPDPSKASSSCELFREPLSAVDQDWCRPFVGFAFRRCRLQKSLEKSSSFENYLHKRHFVLQVWILKKTRSQEAKCQSPISGGVEAIHHIHFFRWIRLFQALTKVASPRREPNKRSIPIWSIAERNFGNTSANNDKIYGKSGVDSTSSNLLLGICHSTHQDRPLNTKNWSSEEPRNGSKGYCLIEFFANFFLCLPMINAFKV